MVWLDKLDRKFRGRGIPNLTLHLVIGQAFVYVLWRSGRPELLQFLYLIPANVFEGEVWRLVTFIFVPPNWHPIFLFFAIYIFYLMGTSLESFWGTFRYNLFLLIGYLATVLVTFALGVFISPYVAATNTFIGGSIFLAFATLNPDFQLMLFFILPVKIKWLALLMWLNYLIFLVIGNWMIRLSILASLCNYVLFFGRDMMLAIRAKRWRMERRAEEFARRNEPVHRCTVCGITDKDDPAMSFRYCTKCEGTPCYCQDHIKNHEHITTAGSE